MVESHTTTLKGLGVPFFGVKSDLVIADDTEPSEVSKGAESKPSESISRPLVQRQRQCAQNASSRSSNLRWPTSLRCFAASSGEPSRKKAARRSRLAKGGRAPKGA